ncbi:MAG: DUF4105 domain-containing protein [Bdellovibrionota bacterium]
MKTATTFKALTILSVSIITACSAFAQQAPMSGAKSTSPDASCSLMENGLKDRFENPVRITYESKLYSGKCVDTNRMRPGQIITKDAHMIRIANFHHEREFWKAEIPLKKEAWAKMYFQILRFPIVEGIEAAHTQIRFIMAPGYSIRLTSQKNENVVKTVKSFIYTVEAAFPKEVNYNFALGAVNNYPIVGRVASAEERVLESKGNSAEQYTVKISPQEIAFLVNGALTRSDSMGMEYFYNTVRPNCTTEAFDLIDTLPRLVGKVRPFNTVLWIDPVAGPSLDALQARGILGPRGPNMIEDLRDGATTPPPEKKKEVAYGLVREVKSINGIPGLPYALVTILPRSKHSAAVSRALFNKIQSSLTTATPKLAQAALASAMVGTNVGDILGDVLGQIQKEMRAFLRSVNTQLPDESVHMMTYLVPWDPNTPKASLVGSGLAADLPFNIASYYQMDASSTKTLLETVIKGYRILQIREHRKAGTSPVYFMGAGIRIELKKNQSEVMLQPIIGWTPQDLPFETYSDQVKFDRIHLPAPVLDPKYRNNLDAYTNELGVLVITHRQRHYQTFNPVLHFEFGSLGFLNTAAGHKDVGVVRVEKYLLEKAVPIFGACAYHEKTVPEMRGKILKGISGNKTVDSRLDGKDIALGIFSFDMVYANSLCKNADHMSKDFDKQRICAEADKSKMGIMLRNVDIRARVNLGGNVNIGCVRHSLITDQFTSEANASIDYQIEEFIKAQDKKFIDVIVGGGKKK